MHLTHCTGVLFLLAALLSISSAAHERDARWTPEQANAWYAKQSWLIGCNFTPSTAISELEMWQAETIALPPTARAPGAGQQHGLTHGRALLPANPHPPDPESVAHTVQHVPH